MVSEGFRKFLAYSNILLGTVVITLQVSTLITLYEWVDYIGVGIWGGCFMTSAGGLTMRRHPRLISMSVLALLSCIIMFIVYAINLANVNYNSYWYFVGYYQDNGDWRIASDITFIVLGSIGTIINMILTAKASSIVVAQPARVLHPMNNYGRPVVTTTTYVTTPMTNYPAAGQQVIYQAQPQQVIYQTQPASYTAAGGVVYQQHAAYSTTGGVVYQHQPVTYPAQLSASTMVQQPTYAAQPAASTVAQQSTSTIAKQHTYPS